MRQKPPTADDEAWRVFNEICDEQLVSEEADEWATFWDFFYTGWCNGPPPDTEESASAEEPKEPRVRRRQRRRKAKLGTPPSRPRAKKKAARKGKQAKKSR